MKIGILGASGVVGRQMIECLEERNVEVEVRKLEIKNEELKRENNKLKTMLKIVVQSIKQFFHKILNIGSERDKDSVVREIKEYYC